MAFGIGSKLKKGLGSIANKVADKLIPKELAPFLPMLAPLFMGPGAGLMSRYLVPQLLTALSTGKTTGGISGTSQGLAGLASFLSDPTRFKLGQKEIAATAEQGPKNLVEIDKTKLDPGFLESDLPGYGGVQGNVDQLDFQQGGRRSMYDATGGGLRQSPAVVTTPNPNYVPGTEASLENIYNISDLDRKAGVMDYLKVGANEARDFIQGVNTANKTPFGDEKLALEGDIAGLNKETETGLFNKKTIPGGKYDPYATDAAGKQLGVFDKGAYTNYNINDPLLVQDAGFGYNMPRRAVTQTMLTAGPGMAVVDKIKADAAAEEAAQQASFDNYYDSRQALFDYFGNAKPNYGMLYGGFANGGRIGYQDGTDEMGVQGLNYEGFEPGGGIMDAIMAVFKNKLKGDPLGTGEPNIARRAIYDALGIDYATGGRVNKNVGGISQLPEGMPPGSQVDGRNGTFIPMGVKEKADDVPAMLSKNEFVMTADAVRAAGGGSVEKGAQRMYDLMNSLEARV